MTFGKREKRCGRAQAYKPVMGIHTLGTKDNIRRPLLGHTNQRADPGYPSNWGGSIKRLHSASAFIYDRNSTVRSSSSSSTLLFLFVLFYIFIIIITINEHCCDLRLLEERLREVGCGWGWGGVNRMRANSVLDRWLVVAIWFAHFQIKVPKWGKPKSHKRSHQGVKHDLSK